MRASLFLAYFTAAIFIVPRFNQIYISRTLKIVSLHKIITFALILVLLILI